MGNFLVEVADEAAPEPPEPAEPPDHAGAQATRHLCVGAYVDRGFRDDVRAVHRNGRRRIAPSYGFDLVPVVRHARRAWLLEVGQQLAMAVCLLLCAVFAGRLAVAIVVYGVVGCLVAGAAVRAIPEAVRLEVADVRDRLLTMATRRRRRPADRRRKQQLEVTLAAGLVVLGIPFVVAARLELPVVGAAVTGLALAACAALTGAGRQWQLNAVLRGGSLRPPPLTRREQVIDHQQSHPCIVYRRPDDEADDPLGLLGVPDVASPFIGSGTFVHRWLTPVIIQLLRSGTGNIGRREYSSPPFAAHDLVEALRSALQQLRDDTGTERLRGLEVRDRIYVAEEDVSSDRTLLRDTIGEPARWRIIDDHESVAHHFLEVSLPFVGGELVTTVFVRVSVKGRTLSLDLATCALTRTLKQFRLMDGFGQHGKGAVVRSAGRSLRALPVDVWQMWKLAEIPLEVVRTWRVSQDRTVVPRRGIGVGTCVAVRERGSVSWTRTAELDRLAIAGHLKIIEQRILRTTEVFLDDHDVDTSVFNSQATSIINSGVLNMGDGSVDVHQSAVGSGAQVHSPSPPPPPEDEAPEEDGT